MTLIWDWNGTLLDDTQASVDAVFRKTPWDKLDGM